MRDLITPDEAEEILGVTPRTIARWSDTGAIWRTFSPGGQRRYDRAEITELAKKLEQAAADGRTHGISSLIRDTK